MPGHAWTDQEKARLMRAADLWQAQWRLVERFEDFDRSTSAMTNQFYRLDGEGWQPPEGLEVEPLRIETHTSAVAQEVRAFLADGNRRSAMPKYLKKHETTPPQRARRPSPEDIERHLSGQPVRGVTDESPEVIRDYKVEYHDPEATWERAKQRNRDAIEYHDKRHQATVRLATHQPVAVCFISDQHISEGTPNDLERMEADAQLVQDTPGLYAVLGGDGVDNHIKHRTAIIASGSKPGDEWRMYDHYLGLFGHSILAMISGNHDDWLKDFTDVDMVGLLAKKHRIFSAPDYVVLEVELGATDEGSFEARRSYTIKVRHQYRYSSSFNQTHSVKRLWEMDDDDFDIGVVCHKHEAAMEPFRKHGIWRWAFRPGSYQITSGYSRRYGYSSSVPTCPTAVLFPDHRRMIGFRDVREAASYLTWLRRGWPETGEVLQGKGVA